jgi:hypothetical protein
VKKACNGELSQGKEEGKIGGHCPKQQAQKLDRPQGSGSAVGKGKARLEREMAHFSLIAIV